MEITQTETQRRKGMKKKKTQQNRPSKSHENIEYFNIEGREKEHYRNIFKEIMMNNCPQVRNDIKPHIQEDQKTQQQQNLTSKHIIVKSPEK